MKTKSRILIISLLLLLLCVMIILTFGRAFPSHLEKQTELEEKVLSLKMSNDIFYRQTINNCGPYSVMAVINILTGEKKDPEVLAAETKFRIIKNLTLPQGVEKLLHDNGVKSKSFILKNKSDKEKIAFLKNQIHEQKPVILLIKVHHILHYVTVIGFDENGFMLYDSMQEKDAENPRKTIVEKPEYTGNRYHTNQELMGLWNDGGYKIFFRNFAIVCSK